MGAAKKLTNEYIASRLDELPTLPTVANELNHVINDPLSDAKDVEKVMANDQSLTTKVLKLINSAYYAIPGGVSNLTRAIAYLGFDTINQVVLTASIFSTLKVEAESSEFQMEGFWKHSVGVGMASESIAKFVKHPTPADLFTCGLIHDMGKIALYVIDPELFLSIVKHAKTKEITFYEAEEELETVKHTLIGVMLAEKWKLPQLIQSAIQYHHQTHPLKRGGASPELQQVIDITILANLFTHALKFGDSGHDKALNAPVEMFERLNIPKNKIPVLLDDLKEVISNADAFLSIIGE